MNKEVHHARTCTFIEDDGGRLRLNFYKRGLTPVFFAMKDLSLLMLYRQHEVTQ